MRALALLSVILGMLVSGANAEPQQPSAPRASGLTSPAEEEPELDYQLVDPTPAPTPDPDSRYRSGGLARTIFLNPCRGGCAVGNKRNDPFNNQSTIPKTPGTLGEFPFGDAAWNDLVKCVKHAYELYNVNVTTEQPTSGTDHVAVLVAGSPQDLGFSGSTLGISPLATDCSPLRNVISFAFAEAHSSDHLSELCATVVHEAGHTFGLDHALQCRDPMTYLVGCGEKLFLNIESTCGEFRNKRFCRCSNTQNSHVKLLNELGPSGRSTPPGEVNIVSPTTATWDGQQVVGSVDEPRWIRSIDLWINGFRWARLPHQAVSDFRFSAPPELSNGILDVEVRSFNDLGIAGVGRLTATKGVACESSSACHAPEVCDQGRCIFPTPTGKLGQTCTAAQECASWECQAYAGEQRCTSICSVGAKDSECPAEFTCVAPDETGVGTCWPTEELPEDGGCCGTSNKRPSPLALLVLLGFWWRGRRR